MFFTSHSFITKTEIFKKYIYWSFFSRKQLKQILQAVSIKSLSVSMCLSYRSVCVIYFIFSQALISCLSSLNKVKTSSLASPLRVLRPLTKATAGMSFLFHSTSNRNICGCLLLGNVLIFPHFMFC